LGCGARFPNGDAITSRVTHLLLPPAFYALHTVVFQAMDVRRSCPNRFALICAAADV
jgi:hypothetical protein